MNKILKIGLTSCLKNVNKSCQVLPKYLTNGTVLKPASSRSFWHMSSGARVKDFTRLTGSEFSRFNHTSLSHSTGEKDLVEFLEDEIAQEKKSLKIKQLPTDLDGFVISASEAELSFTKKSGRETVTVTMNVNHSVDTDEMEEDGNFSEEMRAKPSFDVEIIKDGKTLCFSCSYTQFDGSGDKDTEDNYQINEVSYFEGDYKDKTYSVAADLLDENLYDLFMVVLSEKGITKDFVDRVSEIATSHEHSQYINLLENVRKFASLN